MKYYASRKISRRSPKSSPRQTTSTNPFGAVRTSSKKLMSPNKSGRIPPRPIGAMSLQQRLPRLPLYPLPQRKRLETPGVTQAYRPSHRPRTLGARTQTLAGPELMEQPRREPAAQPNIAPYSSSKLATKTNYRSSRAISSMSRLGSKEKRVGWPANFEENRVGFRRHTLNLWTVPELIQPRQLKPRLGQLRWILYMKNLLPTERPTTLFIRTIPPSPEICASLPESLSKSPPRAGTGGLEPTTECRAFSRRTTSPSNLRNRKLLRLVKASKRQLRLLQVMRNSKLKRQTAKGNSGWNRASK